jgi:hypothetical protein
MIAQAKFQPGPYRELSSRAAEGATPARIRIPASGRLIGHGCGVRHSRLRARALSLARAGARRSSYFRGLSLCHRSRRALWRLEALAALRKRRGGLGRACFSRVARTWAGRRGWFGALPPGVGGADVLPFLRRARLWSGCFYLARGTRAARPRLGRGASRLADERARRNRARSVADAAPNVMRSPGASDAIVSSTGVPAMCASGITGRSPWCSRRLGGAPRGRARGRWGGCGSRRRSRGRPASRRRPSS